MTKEEARKATKSSIIASKRLEVLTDLKLCVGKLHNDLANESHLQESLERMSTTRIQIKLERKVGHQGGSGKWPVHIIMLTCDLLVNGTPPSAVPTNIQTISAALLGSEVSELPSVNYIRECRVIVQNLNRILAAFRLGKVKTWQQIFTNGTTPWYVTSQNLVIGLMLRGEFESMIASSCIFLENETPEKQVEAMRNRV